MIALIVIFQPGLRKIFERAASMRQSRQFDAGAELGGVLGDALRSLADKRQGAIMVFPGKEPIQKWLSGGFELEAKPSLPLILIIFDPNSPGHDGVQIVFLFIYAVYALFLGFRHRPIVVVSRLYS